jgi:hypothetical protein
MTGIMTGILNFVRCRGRRRTPSALEGEGWGGGYDAISFLLSRPPSGRAISAFTRVFEALWRVDLPLKGGGEESVRRALLQRTFA